MVPRTLSPNPRAVFAASYPSPHRSPLRSGRRVDHRSRTSGGAARPRPRTCRRRDAHALLETEAMLCIFALRSGSNAIAAQQCTTRTAVSHKRKQRLVLGAVRNAVERFLMRCMRRKTRRGTQNRVGRRFVQSSMQPGDDRQRIRLTAGG